MRAAEPVRTLLPVPVRLVEVPGKRRVLLLLREAGFRVHDRPVLPCARGLHRVAVTRGGSVPGAALLPGLPGDVSNLLPALASFHVSSRPVVGRRDLGSPRKSLKVNSARLVDVVLEIEDAFEIEVKDEDADKVKTIGDAVKLILSSQA